MSAETKKVLEMVAEGKLSAEDAERLLEKLAGGSSAPSAARETVPGDKTSGPQNPRYLRIMVDAPGRENVNVRVPLNFLRSGMRFMSVLPPRVVEKLRERGIDLSGLAGLQGQELVDALRELNMEVDNGYGKKVHIFCE
jgi:polyhydroxyalkanoate synthesis regulator phasin